MLTNCNYDLTCLFIRSTIICSRPTRLPYYILLPIQWLLRYAINCSIFFMDIVFWRPVLPFVLWSVEFCTFQNGNLWILPEYTSVFVIPQCLYKDMYIYDYLYVFYLFNIFISLGSNKVIWNLDLTLRLKIDTYVCTFHDG